MNKILPLISGLVWSAGTTVLQAQEVYPSVIPEARYTNAEGEELDDASEEQSAPLTGHFTAQVSDLGPYEGRYEWRIWREGQEDSPLVQRYEAETEYTFTQSGTFQVQLYATFVNGTDTIQFPDGAEEPFLVRISESKLEFPNAFTPNGDGINDVYKAKDGYRSIVKFRATIFNRWGQKIYSWTDPAGGWDGKFHGKTVHDGVYFVVVAAEGADGRKFQIKRDVNVLTRHNGEEQSTEQ